MIPDTECRIPDNFQIDNTPEPGTSFTMNRKILMVTYHFPPSPAVGGIRPAKFAKYLPEFGWTPVVLTIREESVKNPDPKRLTELAGARIARSAVWPNLIQLLNRLKSAPSRKRARGDDSQEFPKSFEQYEALKDGFLVNKASRLKKFLKSVFELPDQQVGWLVPAVLEGYRLLRGERFDLIYATAPPETATLVAYALSRLSGARLVLDFRDPCFSHNQKHFSHAIRFSYGIEQRLGEKVIRHAEKIVTATEEYRELLNFWYPELDHEKIAVIPNGFDPDDFEIVRPGRKREKFTVTYIGTFYLGRDPEGFLAALRELIDEGVIRKEEVEVHFVGDVMKAEGKPVREMIARYDMDDCVIVDGLLPYAGAIARIQASDVLLLLAPDQYLCIPAKAYEYIGAGKAILCIAMEGATANLIRGTGAGIVANPFCPGEIKEAIRKLFAEWKEHGAVRTKINAHAFERRTITETLARQLDSLLN
jgi:glycosyltransferase involved in cell wall biosynthesis